MLEKYLQEMHNDYPNLKEFLSKFREVVVWDKEEDHHEGLLRFDSAPSPETAFVFKFEDDQLIHMHTLGMKFCIDIYFFDKHGHFINKWMNVPPGHPGNTMEYGTDKDELNSKKLAKYAVEVVNPNCKPREELSEVSADAAYSAMKSAQDAVNARNFKLAIGGSIASMIIPHAMRLGDKFLTKAGKECKDKKGPAYNACKTQFELKALSIQISALRKSKSQCKDSDCRTSVGLKIDKLAFAIKQKKKQLEYEKDALRRSGGK